MQYTLNPQINLWIDQIHEHILKLYPQVVMKVQPGFRSINYGLLPGMKAVRFYIICYDQKANVGFPNEIDLSKNFPIMKGTGKNHRHLGINEGLIANQKLLNGILKLVFHT